MAKRVQFEGQIHEFPDDATDDEIGSALNQVGNQGKVSQAIASVPKPSNPILNAPEESGLETGHLLSENPKENQYDALKPSMTDPTGRFLGRAANSVKNTVVSGIPSMVHSVIDPPQDDAERAIANTAPGSGLPAPLALAVSRMGKPVVNAAQDYATGKVSPEAAMDVAPEALGEGAGQMLLGKGMEAVANLPKSLKPVTDTVASRAYNSLLGTKPKGFGYGRNPGLGVADEGLTAWSKDSMLDKIRGRQADAGKAIDLHLSDPAVNKPVVDIRAAINNPLNDMEAAAIKAKNLNLADRIADMRDRLNNDYARGTNGKLQPVGPSKLSQLTPLEANAIKQDVGEMTRWTGVPEADAASPAAKEVYRRINDQIEGAAPGIKDINKRYAQLKDAAESMDHKIRLGAKYNPLGSLTDILSSLKWGPVGYASTKALRSTPGMSIIGRAARNLPNAVPEPVPQILGAAAAAPKERR